MEPLPLGGAKEEKYTTSATETERNKSKLITVLGVEVLTENLENGIDSSLLFIFLSTIKLQNFPQQ
jgi:hypothetical protein